MESLILFIAGFIAGLVVGLFGQLAGRRAAPPKPIYWWDVQSDDESLYHTQAGTVEEK